MTERSINDPATNSSPIHACKVVKLHHAKARSEVLVDTSQSVDTLTLLTFILLVATCSLLL